jgi:hypothetical protein
LSLTSNLAGAKALHVRHLNTGYNTVNSAASALLASPISASNLGNIKVAPNQQPPAPAVMRKHHGLLSPPIKQVNNDTTIPQARSIPAQGSRVSHQHLPPRLTTIAHR